MKINLSSVGEVSGVESVSLFDLGTCDLASDSGFGCWCGVVGVDFVGLGCLAEVVGCCFGCWRDVGIDSAGVVGEGWIAGDVGSGLVDGY